MREQHVLPADIERTSMAMIREELRQRGIEIPREQDAIVRRVIHTTADFDYAENLRFGEGAVTAALNTLLCGGATIITDTNMALAGISRPAMDKLGAKACCFMAEPAIREAAAEKGCTRAVASVDHGTAMYPHASFVIGNAPTALLRLAECIEEGYRPFLVVGVPVGFVNVIESKERIFEVCARCGIPAIVAFGRKGGSNVAAAIMNALLYTAADTLDPEKRGWKG